MYHGNGIYCNIMKVAVHYEVTIHFSESLFLSWYKFLFAMVNIFVYTGE